ncbi:hypothetical protein SLS56_010046 [Neofusicoccum ribis]|uniref:IBR domain-containing protein n=1 Tax=Neofusicoccum ribis TaxID=45134 RepID=A0ABR3SFJ2_9PEZI
MDDQSAALILQLQLEDISSILASAKGKGRAGDAPANGQEYALRLTQQELEAGVAILNDRAMGQSIARAVQADRHILAREAEAEEAAARDRRLACEMDGRTAAAADDGASGGAPACDEDADDAAQDEYLAKLMALYVSEADGAELLAAGPGSGADDEDAAGGESSSRGAKRGAQRAAIDRRCEACHDEKKFFDVATLPHCRHDYCRDCLDLLFRLSMTDESLFPPRCCRQPIQLRDVRVFLSAETAREFEERRPELETPNRTYCHLATCSAWIPPRDISDEVGRCPACAAATCTICKAAAHDGECPNDEATQMLLRMADESGWQRCYNCRRVVELDVGCYHMRGLQEMSELLAVATDVHAALHDGNLDAILQHLRENHECTHQHWNFVRGRHQCEECFHTLPQYIFECRQCMVRACNRCRRNRL